MSSLIHTPAAQVAGPLPAAGIRTGADRGTPELSVLRAAADLNNGNIGVWECRPGGWPVRNRPDTEVCYVLSGVATLTDDETGTKVTLSAGDLLVLPPGWSGRWDVTETLRKVYVVF
ncbi:cupin domain-containing protein [Streptomyces sp. NPDC004752]